MLPVSAYAFRAELNGLYLQSSVCRNKAGGSGFEASADTVAGNARARFLLEPSKKDDRHMHVRCCYNNKYWVAVQVQDRWIIGTADEPEEDLSSPSCTLFQALPVKYKHNTYSPFLFTEYDNRWIIGTEDEPEEDLSIPLCTLFQGYNHNSYYRFLHPGLQKFACVVSIGGKTYLQLDDGVDQENKSHKFTFCSVPRKDLPKHVAFKGVNGKYLGTYPLGSWPLNALANVGLGLAQAVSPIYFGAAKLISHQKYLQFHVQDTRDARAIFTTFTNADGTVHIKSSTCGFWRRNSDSDDFISTPKVRDDNDPDSLFKVVNGDGFVALQNLGNNKFCRSLSIHLRHCLRADDDTISNYARFKLEEPLISQEIYDVEFNLNEARIYNNKLITMDSDARTNHTKEVQTGTFSFKKLTEVVSTWETTVSSKRVVGTKFFSSITRQTPVIVLGKEVTLSTESASSRRDTGSSGDSEERTVVQNYTISAGETITAKFVANRASCDVPFSYKQKSVLTNGEEIVTDHDDGIYTGVNKYDFRIVLTPS